MFKDLRGIDCQTLAWVVTGLVTKGLRKVTKSKGWTGLAPSCSCGRCHELGGGGKGQWIEATVLMFLGERRGIVLSRCREMIMLGASEGSWVGSREVYRAMANIPWLRKTRGVKREAGHRAYWEQGCFSCWFVLRAAQTGTVLYKGTDHSQKWIRIWKYNMCHWNMSKSQEHFFFFKWFYRLHPLVVLVTALWFNFCTLCVTVPPSLVLFSIIHTGMDSPQVVSNILREGLGFFYGCSLRSSSWKEWVKFGLWIHSNSGIYYKSVRL